MANDQERLVVLLEARIRDFEKNMAKANATANKQFGAVEARARQSARRLESTFGSVSSRINNQFMTIGKNAAGAFAAALSAKSIADASQQYVALTNTLKVTGLEGRELEQTMGALFQIAQRQGTAIGPLATLYGRVAQSQKELKASSADVLRFTDGIATALRAVGATSDQAKGALLQLSQALSGGVVRAEEFNSVNENARPILEAVAHGLKEAGGSVSALRNLVNDGKVSSEAFFRAFLAGLPVIEAQAAKASGTVGQSMDRVRNAFMFLVGELDKTSGASETAAKNLTSVSDVISKMPGYIKAATEGLASLRGWLNSVASHPFWYRLARMTGATFSEDEARRLGLTLVDPQTPAQGGAGAPRPPEPVKPAPPKVTPVSLADYAVKKKDEGSGGESQDAFDRMTASIEKRIALLQVEASTIDQGAAARDRARMIVELETAARKANADAGKANTAVTDEQRKKIEALADSYAKAREKMETLNAPLMKFARDAANVGENLQKGIVGALETPCTRAIARSCSARSTGSVIVVVGRVDRSDKLNQQPLARRSSRNISLYPGSTGIIRSDACLPKINTLKGRKPTYAPRAFFALTSPQNSIFSFAGFSRRI